VKWIFGIVLLALVAAGALFGVGYYVVPAKTEVSRSVEVERPPSIIYPLLANLRTFNEISPWFDRDPKAAYEYEGPNEGPGQSATWESSVNTVGIGSQKIISVIENERVDMDLNLNGTRALGVWTLAPGKSEAGAKVTWTVTIDCGTDPRNVPCRYLALVSRPGVERDIDAALARLGKVADGLPALEIASLKPEVVMVRQQDFAFVDPDTSNDDESIDQAVRDSLVVVSGFLRKNNLSPAGAPLAMMLKSGDDKISLRVGVPYAGPNPITQIEAKTGKAPSGRALKVIATGSRASLKPVYARIEAYMEAHRLVASGASWEVYPDDPASTAADFRRTVIYYPLKSNAPEAPPPAAPSVSAAPPPAVAASAAPAP
jgi:effector-binding domain-containing protein